MKMEFAIIDSLPALDYEVNGSFSRTPTPDQQQNHELENSIENETKTNGPSRATDSMKSRSQDENSDGELVPSVKYLGRALSIKINPMDASLPIIGKIPDSGVDIYVTSAYLILFWPHKQLGARIPYQCITVHAIQGLPNTAVYMQLEKIPYETEAMLEESEDKHDNNNNAGELSSYSGNEREEDETEVFEEGQEALADVMEVTITDPSAHNQQDMQEKMQALFDSLSACSALHPDLESSEGEDGNDFYKQKFDSLGGDHDWITADNVDSFSGFEVEDSHITLNLQPETDTSQINPDDGTEGNDEPDTKYRRIE
ncbi:regulator of volume decrease after cellular swelling-domain-containing protein [Dipodascopsis uninucleata]